MGCVGAAGGGKCICLFKQLFGKPDVLAPRPAAGWTASARCKNGFNARRRTPSARLVRHARHAISQRSYARLFIHRLPAGLTRLHAGHELLRPRAPLVVPQLRRARGLVPALRRPVGDRRLARPPRVHLPPPLLLALPLSSTRSSLRTASQREHAQPEQGAHA